MKLKKFLTGALAAGLLLAATAPEALAAWTITHKTSAAPSVAHTINSANISIAQGHMILLTIGARLANTADAVVVTDAAGNTYSTRQCQSGTSGQVGVIAWAFATTALSSQAVSISDGSGTNVFTAVGYSIEDVTGGPTTNLEDTGVYACNTQSNTTSPTVTSGAAAQSGDLFIANYSTASSFSGLNYVEDSTNAAWTQLTLYGNTSVSGTGAQVTNAGTGALTHNPATASRSSQSMVVGFAPLGGGGPSVSPSTNVSLTGAGVR